MASRPFLCHVLSDRAEKPPPSPHFSTWALASSLSGDIFSRLRSSRAFLLLLDMQFPPSSLLTPHTAITTHPLALGLQNKFSMLPDLPRDCLPPTMDRSHDHHCLSLRPSAAPWASLKCSQRLWPTLSGCHVPSLALSGLEAPGARCCPVKATSAATGTVPRTL